MFNYTSYLVVLLRVGMLKIITIVNYSNIKMWQLANPTNAQCNYENAIYWACHTRARTAQHSAACHSIVMSLTVRFVKSQLCFLNILRL